MGYTYTAEMKNPGLPDSDLHIGVIYEYMSGSTLANAGWC